MSSSNHTPAPILVMGIGNSLLGDDGVGIRLVEECSRSFSCWSGQVEFLEGGTQGLALLGAISGRSALILLDAVALGAEPGKVHLLQNEDVLELGGRSSTAHEGNAGELLKTASLLGDLPKDLLLIGVEPESIRTGLELSAAVRDSLPQAIEATRTALEDRLCRIRHS